MLLISQNIYYILLPYILFSILEEEKMCMNVHFCMNVYFQYILSYVGVTQKGFILK